MVILFSNRKNKLEKEIIEILTACGADFISDKTVAIRGGSFTAAALYKPTTLNIKKGVALILDDSDRFLKQILPSGISGVCEDNNNAALRIFERNGVPVITCGANCKNTITVSSINGGRFIVTLQRQILDIKGNLILPQDFNLNFQKTYSPEAIMLSCAALCLEGSNFNFTKQRKNS